MNNDTVVSFSGGSLRNQMPSFTTDSTTQTLFTVNTDNGSGATAILYYPTGSEITGSGAPQDPNINPALSGLRGRYTGDVTMAGRPTYSASMLDGRPATLRFTGNYTPVSNSGQEITFKIYNGTSTSGTAIFSEEVAIESITATNSFIIELELFWSSASEILSGQYWYTLNGSTLKQDTWAAFTNVTSLTLADMSFCASYTLAEAANVTFQPIEFSITRL